MFPELAKEDLFIITSNIAHRSEVTKKVKFCTEAKLLNKTFARTCYIVELVVEVTIETVWKSTPLWKVNTMLVSNIFAFLNFAIS